MRHVGNDMAPVTPQTGPTLNATLAVKAFVDRRHENQPAVAFTAKKNPVVVDGQKLCVNVERGYAGNIPQELASLVERHVVRRRVLKARNADAVAYELEGSVLALYGARVSAVDGRGGAALVGGLPGLAIADATARAQGRIVVVFSNLRLRNLRDGTTKPLKAVGTNIKGDIPGADCRSIFTQVDRQLQEVLEILSIEVEEAIRTWQQP